MIQGILTVLVGIAGFWLVYDFPDTASFLTEEERVLVIARLQGDDQFSAAGEAFSMKYFWDSARDFKTWIGMAMFAAAAAPLYAFSLFIPT